MIYKMTISVCRRDILRKEENLRQLNQQRDRWENTAETRKFKVTRHRHVPRGFGNLPNERDILLTFKGGSKLKGNNFQLRAFQTLCQYLVPNSTQDIAVWRKSSLITKDFQLPESYQNVMKQFQIIARRLCFSSKFKVLIDPWKLMLVKMLIGYTADEP